MTDYSFSNKLDHWIRGKGRKTFGDLENLFGEKSFAVAFLLLMITAALPLPTGGITHIFEIITMLLALELVFGRKKIWTPKFWQRRDLGSRLKTKALPKLVSFIRWFEVRSRKRLPLVLNNALFLRLVGGLVFLFALASISALPFTGLDTLPALAIVLISMSLILEDMLLLVVALAVGTSGIIIEIALGSVVFHHLHF